MGDTYVVHDEVIRVGFDDAAALAQLARLQALADAVFSKIQGPQGGGGGATPSGSAPASSGTVPSGAAMPAPMSPASGGGGNAASGASPGNAGTTSSGNMPSPGSSGGGGGSGGGSGGQGGGGSGGGGGGSTGGSGGGSTGGSGGGGGFPGTMPSGYARQQGINAVGAAAAQMASGTTIGSDVRAGLGLVGALGAAAGSPAGAALAAGTHLLSAMFDSDTPMQFTRQKGSLMRSYGVGQIATDIGQKDPEEDFKAFLSDAVERAGMAPEEAVGAYNAYARRAGNVKDDSKWLEATTYGVDSSTSGSLDSLRYLDGASGNAGTNARLAGAGQGLGIYGGLGEFLQKLSGQFDRLIDRGMKVDLEGSAGFLEAMAEAGYSGRQASDTMRANGDARVGAKDQLLSPFQGLMQKAVLAKALQSTNNLPDALRMIEGTSDEQGMQYLRDLVGPEIAGLGFSAGISSLGTDKAMQLGRGPLGKGRRRKPIAQEDATLFLARETAGKESRDITDRSFTNSTFQFGLAYEEAGLSEKVEQGRKVVTAAFFYGQKIAKFGQNLQKALPWLNAAVEELQGLVGSGGAVQPGADRDDQ